VNDKVPVSSIIPFIVLPSGTHTVVPVLLPLLETFLEVFFWNHLQTACHVGNDISVMPNSFPFIISLNMENSQKSHGDSLGE
jgi:hypothetical protein